MSVLWSMDAPQLHDFISDESNREIGRVNVGDISVVCHTSNQAHLLQPLIDSAKVITDKIIILDDCSQDNTIEVAKSNGCEVYSIPEGWLYTHGFGKLIEFQVSICESDYHFQVDTGETIYIPKCCPTISGDIVGNIWLNEVSSSDMHGPKQIKFNRLLSTKVKVNFPAYIHGAPTGIGGAGTTKSEVVILHEHIKNQNLSDYYVDRKNRLYYKLLKKGFEDNKLENNWWYDYCVKNKDSIELVIKDTENRIGELMPTKDIITKIN